MDDFLGGKPNFFFGNIRPSSKKGITYTLEKTNIAGWKMEPDMKMGNVTTRWWQLKCVSFHPECLGKMDPV